MNIIKVGWTAALRLALLLAFFAIASSQLPWGLVSRALAYTHIYSESGDPEGPMTLWLKFQEGSGTSVENSSFRHVCSNPAYSASNWMTTNATLTGDTGTPTWLAATAITPPGVQLTATNNQYILLSDNNPSCTTGNDPFDTANNTETMNINAYLKTPSVTCSDLGSQMTILSKWDAGSSDCSYRAFFTVIDSNGGGCNTADLKFRPTVQIVDSGGTYSCASPCELTTGVTSNDVDPDTNSNLGLRFKPSTVSPTANYIVSGKIVSPGFDCNGTTNFPTSTSLNNSATDLYIGSDLSSNAFNGTIYEVRAINQDGSSGFSSSEVLLDARILNAHFDSEVISGFTEASNSPPLLYGGLNNGATLVSGMKGNAISLDGSDDYARLAHDFEVFTGLTGQTISFWVKPHDADGGGTNEQALVSQWVFNDDASCTTDLAASAFYFYLDTTGKLNFEIANGSSESLVTSTNALTDNKWYHIYAGKSTSGAVGIPPSSQVLFIDGTLEASTSTSITPSSSTNSNNVYVGTTSVTAPGTTCASGTLTKFFDGEIDELHVSSSGIVANPSPVVINEVNFLAAEEKIELYLPSDVTGSVDLDGAGIMNCSQHGSRWIEFDDACGNCASKVLDPGDIALVVLNGGGPGVVDTSCNGAATTCTWNAKNSAASSDLRGGNLDDTDDGVVLAYGDLSGFAAPILGSAVVWGSLATLFSDCSNYFYQDSTWVESNTMSIGLVTDDTKSLCLVDDGDGTGDISKWAQCNDSSGSLNSTASTAVALVDFSATFSGDSVVVAWQTASELNTLGFQLYRSLSAKGPFTLLNADNPLITARGSAQSGATYSYTDFQADGVRYYYKLQEVEYSSMVTDLGIVRAKNALSETQAVNESSSGENNSDPSIASDTASYKSSGCGQIVQKEEGASFVLILALILIVLVTRQTYAPFRLF